MDYIPHRLHSAYARAGFCQVSFGWHPDWLLYLRFHCQRCWLHGHLHCHRKIQGRNGEVTKASWHQLETHTTIASDLPGRRMAYLLQVLKLNV